MTDADAGIVAGAVYTPAALMVPTVLDPPVTPLTDHVRFAFVVPVSVAVKAWAAPSDSDAVDGATVTLIGVGGGGVGAATTAAETLLLVTEPAPGWRTANVNVPAAAIDPSAFNCDAETYVVFAATPLTSTCESETNFDPVNVSVYAPTTIGTGVTIESTGTGLVIVSFVDPMTAVRDVLRAAMVTAFVAGMTTGGV